MGCIYKITNTIDGKSYIGQTHRDPDVHWRNYRYGATHHKKYGKRGRAILDAIVSIGIDKFQFEVIENCPDDMLNDRERHWITALNTNVRMGGFGYNLTCGGQDRYTRKPQTSHKHSDVIREKIRSAHLGRSHVGWRKAPHTEQERRNKSIAADAQKVKIERWSTSGTFLELHDSLSAVQNWLMSRGLINANMRLLNINQGRVRMYRGFYWRRAGDLTPVPTVATRSNWVAVEQLTQSNQLIERFSSVKHAVVQLRSQGIKAHKDRINACLKNVKERAYGFKWRIAQFS